MDTSAFSVTHETRPYHHHVAILRQFHNRHVYIIGHYQASKAHSCIVNKYIYSIIHILLNKFCLTGCSIFTFKHHTPFTLSIPTINIHIHTWIETTLKYVCYLYMYAHIDGWHWQILYHTSLPCRIKGEAPTKGLGYITLSWRVYSAPPAMTLAASSQEHETRLRGIFRGTAESAVETRVAEGTTQHSCSATWSEHQTGFFFSVLHCTRHLLE
jgi:hypothetical protein